MRSRALLKSREVFSGATSILGISVLLLTGGTTAFAQAPATNPPAQHAMTDPADQNRELTAQIAELRAEVARLQAAVQQSGPGKKATPKSGMNMTPAPAKGMGMMDDKSEMGMPAAKGTSASAAMPPGGGMGMKDNQGEMGGMPGGGMSKAPAGAMGMCCMGEMGGMSGGASGGMSGGAAPAGAGMPGMGAPTSAMPGQPGASHLYHVGSTGFFLNHSQHITLTADQRVTLNRLKEKSMLDRASEQRKIDQAEQELYTLTGADQLDNSRVQAKVGEIEKLRAEQRMNFIQAVGEASKVLTHDQHQALIGTMAAGKK